jgi:hypothetical protein
MINTILDTFIPGDYKLGMPPASRVDFNAYQLEHGIEQIVIDFLSELTKISLDTFAKEFEELDEEQRVHVLDSCKLINIRLFSTFLKHCFQAYYSDKGVLSILQVGSSPPFPEGNVLEEDDWSILIPVYERGSIYRTFDKD